MTGAGQKEAQMGTGEQACDFLEKLLDGAGVEWVALGSVTTIKTGNAVNKNMIAANPGDYPVINSGKEPLGFINCGSSPNVVGKYQATPFG